MSERFKLQESRLARCATLALLVAACASPRPSREQPARKEPPPAPPAPSASREAPRAAVPHGWIRYVVQPGDTLGRIAACRGVETEVLARANEIEDPRRLQAGAALRVPPRDRCAQPAMAAAPPQAPRPAPDASALEHSRVLLETARSRYEAADFEAALQDARSAAAALEGKSASPEAGRLGARCHALAALAAAGLERREEAIAEFRLAFALDPGFQLARDDSSPRIQELVAAARQKRSDPAP